MMQAQRRRRRRFRLTAATAKEFAVETLADMLTDSQQALANCTREQPATLAKAEKACAILGTELRSRGFETE